MSKRFYLFAEQTFESYAYSRFTAIASDIERMSSVEAMMYADDFDEFLQKTLNFYKFQPVGISFDNKVVDLITRNTKQGTRVFVEYSLTVTGDAYCLGLMPEQPVNSVMDLPVRLDTNVISFEIDSREATDDFNAQTRKHIKKEYEKIKKYIQDSIYNLDRTIKHYNAEMEKYLVPHLANKLRKARHDQDLRESLNFR